jgi:hypothetical protein
MSVPQTDRQTDTIPAEHAYKRYPLFKLDLTRVEDVENMILRERYIPCLN